MAVTRGTQTWVIWCSGSTIQSAEIQCRLVLLPPLSAFFLARLSLPPPLRLPLSGYLSTLVRVLWWFCPYSNGGKDVFWQSRDNALLIKGGANYSYDQINDDLTKFLVVSTAPMRERERGGERREREEREKRERERERERESYCLSSSLPLIADHPSRLLLCKFTVLRERLLWFWRMVRPSSRARISSWQSWACACAQCALSLSLSLARAPSVCVRRVRARCT